MSPYKEYKGDFDIDIEFEDNDKEVELCECCKLEPKTKGSNLCETCAEDVWLINNMPMHVQRYFIENYWED